MGGGGGDEREEDGPSVPDPHRLSRSLPPCLSYHQCLTCRGEGQVGRTPGPRGGRRRPRDSQLVQQQRADRIVKVGARDGGQAGDGAAGE